MAHKSSKSCPTMTCLRASDVNGKFQGQELTGVVRICYRMGVSNGESLYQGSVRSM